MNAFIVHTCLLIDVMLSDSVTSVLAIAEPGMQTMYHFSELDLDCR